MHKKFRIHFFVTNNLKALLIYDNKIFLAVYFLLNFYTQHVFFIMFKIKVKTNLKDIIYLSFETRLNIYKKSKKYNVIYYKQKMSIKKYSNINDPNIFQKNNQISI